MTVVRSHGLKARVGFIPQRYKSTPAIRPAVLEHRRDACPEIGRDLAVNVDDSALMIEASHVHGRFVVGREVSLLGDAIEDSSGTAAAESQRRRGPSAPQAARCYTGREKPGRRREPR
jgi:hypothetical protein